LFIALTLLFTAVRGGGLLLFAWPAVAFLVVSLTYLSGNVSFFGKRQDGSRHWFAKFLLLPYLAFVHIVWLLQTMCSRESPADTVNDKLIVARRLRAHELPTNVSIVCDLTSEICDPEPIRSSAGYTCFSILDAGVPQLQELVDKILALKPSDGTRLLIHCANGHGRTGMVAAAWLLANRYVTSIDEALRILRTARPGISLRKRQRELLAEAFPLLRKTIEQSVAPEPQNRAF
jgi:protein-tyrosine phosphatase